MICEIKTPFQRELLAPFFAAPLHAELANWVTDGDYEPANPEPGWVAGLKYSSDGSFHTSRGINPEVVDFVTFYEHLVKTCEPVNP